MKKYNKFFLIIFSISILTSCNEESVSDDFEEVNGDVAVKLMESISVSDAEDSSDYNSMTVAELKDLLKAAGKPVSGKKADLIERLNS